MGGAHVQRERRFEAERGRMVQRLAAAGIQDPRVLAALRETPRHRFLPEALWERAYANTPLPIGAGQTISTPEIVAMMSAALELRGTERVLEVGTGSAYQAAVLCRLAREVVSMERIPELAEQARERLAELGHGNITVLLGDGGLGWPERAPYDAVLVTAGGPDVPPPLLEQLAEGGRLVGPFGPPDVQVLLRVRKHAGGGIEREELAGCRFVDLLGAHGRRPQ